MKNKFQVICLDGSIKTILAKSMLDAAQQASEFISDAVDIKSIDAISLKNRTKRLNSDLSSVSYLAPNEINPFFRRALEDAGFPVPMQIAEIGSGAQGELRSMDIGGVFLCVTWYRMPSGKFEIVAYCN